MDPLLRPSEQTSELGRPESSWQQIEGLSQPKGGEWKPDETLGADAELSRSLTKVVQQLQWLQAQREATAIDGQVLSSSIEELVLPQRQGNAGSAGDPHQSQGQPRLLLLRRCRDPLQPAIAALLPVQALRHSPPRQLFGGQGRRWGRELRHPFKLGSRWVPWNRGGSHPRSPIG